jgi:hypothetical protein
LYFILAASSDYLSARYELIPGGSCCERIVEAVFKGAIMSQVIIALLLIVSAFMGVLLFLIVVLGAALLIFARGDKKDPKEVTRLPQEPGAVREDVV